MTQKQIQMPPRLFAQPNFRWALFVAVSVLSLGAVFYHVVEGMSWLDAFYFCTTTLTTVGYGDIFPQTDAGKLFTIFYILIGVGILGAFVNLFVKNAALRRTFRQQVTDSAEESASVETLEMR